MSAALRSGAIEMVGAVPQYPTTLRPLGCPPTVVLLKWAMYKVQGHLYSVLINGTPQQEERPIVRLQSYCSIGQTLGGALCDCDDQLQRGKEIVANNPGGMLILNWSQEGRGAGLEQHFRAHVLHEVECLDSVQAYNKLGLEVDPREYYGEIEILREMGLNRIRLLTNNPKKIEPLQRADIDVERMEFPVIRTDFNGRQLDVREQKLGHLIGENGVDNDDMHKRDTLVS